MKEVWMLLRPRLWSFKNRGRSKRRKGRTLRILFLATLGLVFWGGTFFSLYRVLIYFQRFEDFGDVLAYKLLSMALITFFSLLIFSGILTSLSKLYLSKDLPLVHSLPVPRQRIFLARWMESTLDSSWMVLVYSLPLFLCYGIVYKGGVFYYVLTGFQLLPLCLIASSLSALIVALAAVCLPAGHIRSVFLFLGLFVFLLLLISFRLMRPERFANPESFTSVVLYLKTMESSNSPLLPATWLYDSLRSALSGAIGDSLFNLALTWSCAVSLIFVMIWVSGSIYFSGLSKAQTAPRRIFRSMGFRRIEDRLHLNFLSGPTRAFAVKEIKTFFRDKTQWTQIFLVAALVVIYLYNFSVLPLEKSPVRMEYLQNLISFFNMGLAAFVLSSVSARFVFPAVSMEGNAFWIVKSSPISIRQFLWVKFFVYFLPLLLLTEVLVVVTNLLLQVTPFIMVLSVLTILFMVPGIVAMGISLGAMYPDLRSENPLQSVTSLGGLLYMTLSLGFIAAVVILEAGPVYTVFMMGVRGGRLSGFQWVWMVGSFSAVIFLCLLATFLPMRMGEKRMALLYP